MLGWRKRGAEATALLSIENYAQGGQQKRTSLACPPVSATEGKFSP
jgi:hypothetical protein